MTDDDKKLKDGIADWLEQVQKKIKKEFLSTTKD